MSNVYYCPHCQAVLNPGRDIVLRAEHKKRKGLLLLSPTPGDYNAVFPPGFSVEKNARVEFFCPVCTRDLTSNRDQSMAELVVGGPDVSREVVAFSKVYGHHATYFVAGESVRTYGEHAVALDVNFFGEGPL